MIKPDKQVLLVKALFSVRQAAADLHAALPHMPMQVGAEVNQQLRAMNEIERVLERIMDEQT
jgi:CRISPR/Cas system CSM-associated protein Csm2 small subunit